ncbi:MAG: hypothetical protein A3F84_10960 [Candidatus Handelsmanbacteria bacterium RIFCSPLOWO2_12_FULL_64_10]|uniref:Uncharacterized protein n=1 Tax=Handelsmanbacteria sp. (strain RIFCSPLOWO2_12_FULL_64_10) TaxID=1817868 RepID=A0A1F6C5L7_HANXR|nr:MAG: hypothetical protein A3F84_10960 [Candidatus Handelsmanbacteria bacterium RIFCSPLOWO2_12_FULL_64_10]
MNTLRGLERAINQRLRKINADYGVANLARNADGTYEFELKVSVDPRRFHEVGRVLRKVLGTLPVERVVQAKYYLNGSLAEQIRKRAAKEGLTQSQFVSRCLAEHIDGKWKSKAAKAG